MDANSHFDFDPYADRLREECGVFGVFGHPDAAALTALGLHALQHRGQEAAGIAVSDGQRARLHKDEGLVANVFTPSVLAPLTGYHSIGHTRYSTTGSSAHRNIQPFLVETMHGPLALIGPGFPVVALAARDAALNRFALPARTIAATQAGRARPPVATARRHEEADGEILPDTGSRSVVLELPVDTTAPPSDVPRRQLRRVPDVGGLTLRNAVRSLHSAGFRVQLARNASPSSATEPAAGVLASPGTLVRLRYRR